MRLVRNSINLGSETNGKWLFTIEGNPEQETDIERIETALRSMETGVVFAEGKFQTFNDFCDLCPLYNEGIGCGFWVPIELVQEFKAAWKIAKKK